MADAQIPTREAITIFAKPTRSEIVRWAESALRNAPDGSVTAALMNDLIADFADGLSALRAPKPAAPAELPTLEDVASTIRCVEIYCDTVDRRSSEEIATAIQALYEPAIAAQAAEIERLTRERDEAKRQASIENVRANFLAETIRDCPEARTVWGQKISDETAEQIKDLDTSAAAIAAQAAEIERLTRERDDLPWRVRDIQRGLILFRTSNNAHSEINFEALTFKIELLPQSAKEELAALMRSYAEGLLPTTAAEANGLKAQLAKAQAALRSVQDYISEHEPRCYSDTGGLARGEAFREIGRVLTLALSDAAPPEPEPADVEALRRERDEWRAEAERLEGENDELRGAPWPEWATQCLKFVREYSGYDGYDDAYFGVDLPGELNDAITELESAAERETARANAAEATAAGLVEALKPFAKLSFSFDGFDLDPATLVFNGREYGQFRSDHHEAFQKMIDQARAALAAAKEAGR